MGHTKGKWTLNRIGKNGWDVLCGTNQTIAQVFIHYLSEPEEAIANAQLIVTAPILLTALEDLYNDCRNVPMDDQRGTVMEAAYEAITKAKLTGRKVG